MAKKAAAEGDPIIIKKYANRRLYNTAKSSYVTLDDLADLCPSFYSTRNLTRSSTSVG